MGSQLIRKVLYFFHIFVVVLGIFLMMGSHVLAAETSDGSDVHISSLRMTIHKAMGAAVFSRDLFVWIVFSDSLLAEELEALTSYFKGFPEVFSNVDDFSDGWHTILRVHMANKKNILGVENFSKGELLIHVDAFSSLQLNNTNNFRVRAQISSDEKNYLSIEGGEAQGVVRIADPVVGDTLFIVPFRDTIYQSQKLFYSNFEILKSSQGFALATRSSQINLVQRLSALWVVSNDINGLDFSVDKYMDLLSLFGKHGVSRVKFFDFELFVPDRYSYQSRLSQLLLAISNATAGTERAKMILELVQFYFANRIYVEALGFLKNVDINSVDEEHKRVIEFTEGVLLVMLYRPEEALKIFNKDYFSQFADGILWKSVAYAQSKQWANALVGFSNSLDQMKSYTPPFKIWFIRFAVQTYVHTGRYREAEDLLEELAGMQENLSPQDKMFLLYHQAYLWYKKYGGTKVNDWLMQVQAGPSEYYALKASVLMYKIAYAEKSITTARYIALLLPLNYRWRGGEFELDILLTLSGLYENMREYRKALDTIKYILKYFPDSNNQQYIDRMRDIFVRFFAKEHIKKMNPLEVFSIYEDYRNLLPFDEIGNHIINVLSSYLINLQLLPEAIRLLNYSVFYRNVGTEQAKTGEKLAFVYLLDKQYEKALKVLDETDVVNLGHVVDSSFNTRHQLRAEIYRALGRNSEALDVLIGDDSKAANLIRRDIFWNTKQWFNLSKILLNLIDSTSTKGQPFSQETAIYVLHRMMALAMAGDQTTLSLAAREYKSQMKNAELFGIFNFLVSNTNINDTDTMNMVANRIFSNKDYESFLKNYKKLYVDNDN